MLFMLCQCAIRFSGCMDQIPCHYEGISRNLKITICADSIISQSTKVNRHSMPLAVVSLVIYPHASRTLRSACKCHSRQDIPG